MKRRLNIALVAIFVGLALSKTVFAQDLFKQGSQEYGERHYEQAAKTFSQMTIHSPSSAAFHDLGDAEWQAGHTGPAILAWERAEWLDAFNHSSRDNLRLARKTRLLDSPELTWFEACSTWLPVNAWAWIASLAFWVAATMIICPGIFHWRKRALTQALAALAFALFLLTLPALAGVGTRTKLGVILQRDTPLRLTPTLEAENIARLAEGEIVRSERVRGNFIFIRTANVSGWIAREQFGAISKF